MAWGSGTGRITVSKSVSKQCIAQKEVNYDSGENTAPRIKVHGIFLVFVKATQTVTTIRGLSKAAAENLVNAADATASRWNAAWAAVNGVKLFEIPYESYSKTTSMRMVDPSGQYEVEITETEQQEVKQG